MKILIDNGHGYDTKGKRSPDGRLLEWEWTRDIAGRLEGRLLQHCIEAKRIVVEPNDVPLSERCRRVNILCGGGDALLVSLHVNASGLGKEWGNARGFSAWVSPNASARSRMFGDLIEKEAKDMGLKGNRANRNACVGNFAIVRDTRCPAVLTENLFMDNMEDALFLLSERGKDAIVTLHFNAIMKYIGIR